MKYLHTPIQIQGDIVLAWCWNGQERSGDNPHNQLPVFRLKKPPRGGWRNGRILSIPFRSSYVTSMAPKH